MEKIKWCFPANNGGDEQGLNNSLIETFNDNPLKSLAREICQNSLDASLNENKVVVEFKTFTLAKQNFPNLDEFEKAIKSCKNFSNRNVNPKTRKFFEKAEKILQEERYSFLRISDFNTTGLLGSEKERGTDWTNLVRSTGASEKDASKGGSFGIGKGAPFACSDIRTVFYSTLDKNGVVASQGVSRLISFNAGKNPDGTDLITQGTGYLGIDEEYKIKPIRQMILLEEGFERNTSGTDIYIPCLKQELAIDGNDFQGAIVNEVLDGFLIAIWKEKLEVIVNDFIINKSTLPATVEKFKNNLVPSVVYTYELLYSNETIWKSIDLTVKSIPIGKLNLAVAMRYDGNNKISMIRSSGMKIIDKDKLCPSLRFTGLVLIEGEELNSWLRELENPSHNKWEPKRYRPAQSRELLNNLYDTIKDELNEMAGQVYDTNIDIEGAGDYLPDLVVEDWKKKDFEVNPNDKLVLAEVQVNKNVTSNEEQYETDFSDIIEEEVFADSLEIKSEDIYEKIRKTYTAHKKQVKRDIFDSQFGLASKDFSPIKANHIRIFCTDRDKKSYKLLFIPSITSEKGYIIINKVAENLDKMPVEILGVPKGIYHKGNKVGYFSFVKNETISVDLTIKGDEYSAMEVKLYAYKG